MTLAIESTKLERGWPPAGLEDLENKTITADFTQMCIDVSEEIEFDARELADHPLAYRGIVAQIRSKAMEYQYVSELGRFDSDVVTPVLGALGLSAKQVASGYVDIGNVSLGALRFSNGGLYAGVSSISPKAAAQDIALQTADLVNVWTADATDSQRLTLLSGLLAIRGVDLDFLKFGDEGTVLARIQGDNEIELPLTQNSTNVEEIAVQYGTYYGAEV